MTARPTKREKALGALLPCPFCGRQPDVRKQAKAANGEDWWHVGCTKPRAVDCPVFAYTGGQTKELAIERWNTRTP